MVPVVNENDTVATDEIRFGDNDRLAALVAHVSRAERADPAVRRGRPLRRRPAPRAGADARSPTVTGPQDLANVKAGKAGRQRRRPGRHVHQGRLGPDRHRRPGIPTVVTSAGDAARALAGEATGTYFAPAGTRPRTRLLWLAHAAVARGTLRLDDGRGRGGHRPPGLPAAGRHHRRRRDLRGRRPGRPHRRGGPTGRPRPGQLRRQRAPVADGPLHPLAVRPS